MEIDGEESSNIADRRDGGGGSGGGGGFGVGGLGGGMGGSGFGIPMGGGLFKGGFGLIAVVVVALVLGVDPMALLGGLGGSGGTTQQVAPQPRQAARPAGDDPERRFVALVLKSTEMVWEQQFKELGRQYAAPTLVLFRNQTPTACGTGQTAMGPFYCPGDRKAYIDLAFFDELATRFNAPGRFPQAYVLAHEVGHHVQNLLGISGKVQQMRQSMSKRDGNALSVRTELQADCFAGVWAFHAAKQVDGVRVKIGEQDVDQALAAASSIGDDRLQKQAQGRVVPDSFTHGSSAQRVRWFKAGLENGDVRRCDTFKAQQL